jgi:DNA-binding transcriptional LysR family regulator
MRFDLVDLRLFIHVAEAGSITHGSERANLALASASARIRGMEQKLGVDLLKRDRRGVSLTSAGQCLLDHARLVIEQVERLRGDLGDFARGLTGSVRVLCNTAAFSEHLPEALASFLTANPTINIDLEERESADIGKAIASGAADIGIAADAALTDAVRKFPFRPDRLVCVVASGDPLANRRQVDLRDVIDREFVGLSRERALQRHIAGHVARLGATMKLRVQMGGFDAICGMVEAGVGIGVVPEAAAERCRRSMKITLAHIGDSWARRRLAVCVRRSRTLPVAATRLVAHLRRDAEAQLQSRSE